MYEDNVELVFPTSELPIREYRPFESHLVWNDVESKPAIAKSDGGIVEFVASVSCGCKKLESNKSA